MTEALHLDHVLIGVRELAAATARLRREHGLVALPGGVLAGGLRNAIVPFGDGQYLEMLAVDEPGPDLTPAQQWIADATAGGDRLVWFAVRPDDLDAVAQRTGRRVIDNVAHREGGPMQGGWRSVWPAGGARSGLPFFIEYVMPWREQKAVRDTNYARAASPAQPGSIAAIDVSGVDAAELWSWLGVTTSALPLRLVPGHPLPGISAVRIAAPSGEITIT